MSMLSKLNFPFIFIFLFSPTGCELKAHERDILQPAPQILKPPAPREKVSMDDVTDFPE